MRKTPYHYQECAAQITLEYLEEQKGNPLICIPTGGGKSIVMAVLTEKIIQSRQNQRIIIASHVQELLQQDYDELREYLHENISCGIYCSGLNRRDKGTQIIVAGVQSIYKRVDEIGYCTHLFIDEAHLLSPNDQTMYRKFIAGLKAYNPHIRIIGLTATPYRMKGGLLTEGKERIFTDIVVDIPMTWLIEEGYLVAPMGKGGLTKADTSEIRMIGGEFSEGDVQKAMNRTELTKAAMEEVFGYRGKRKMMLFYCAGVEHVKAVHAVLCANDIDAEYVVGDTPKEQRKDIFKRARNREIEALVTCKVATTGLNIPCVELIVLLLMTNSAGLYVQIIGRGTRLCPEIQKENCLVLDFGGNLERFGPVDKITTAGRRSKALKPGEAPFKVCPACRSCCPCSSRECGDCGHEFPEREFVKHEKEASELSVTSIEKPTIVLEEHTVTKVLYIRHKKIGKPDSLRVDYICGMRVFTEWVHLEHNGWVKENAYRWWGTRSNRRMPHTVVEAVKIGDSLTVPRTVIINTASKYNQVQTCNF